MGAYLSRKYHYILRTAKAQTLPHEKRMEAAHALNDLGIDTEADLPEWVQKLINDTFNDPQAVSSREQKARIHFLEGVKILQSRGYAQQEAERLIGLLGDAIERMDDKWVIRDENGEVVARIDPLE